MKRLSAMIFAFALWAGYAAASEATPRLRVALDTSLVEELVITATDLSKYTTTGLFIRAGLTDVAMVHNYDPELDAWVFVGTDPSKHVVYVKDITEAE